MDQNTPMDETRSNNMVTSATGSNTGKISETTRCIGDATGSNDTLTAKDTIYNVTVANPFQVAENEDHNDGETLDDLGPELAKMGRILAREILNHYQRP